MSPMATAVGLVVGSEHLAWARLGSFRQRADRLCGGCAGLTHTANDETLTSSTISLGIVLFGGTVPTLDFQAVFA